MKVMIRALLAAVGLAALLTTQAATAADAAYVEGKDYTQLSQQTPPADPKRIQVQEFFSYGCPHCFAADPMITTWVAKKGADVDFERVPQSLGRETWANYGQAFYAAKLLGVGDKMHRALFDAIHVDGNPLSDGAAIKALFVKTAGVKPEDFDAAWSSFSVTTDMRRAEALGRQDMIDGVPTVIVDGRYKVPASEGQMKVVDFLLNKIRAERKGA